MLAALVVVATTVMLMAEAATHVRVASDNVPQQELDRVASIEYDDGLDFVAESGYRVATR